MSGPAEQSQRTPSLHEVYSLLDDNECHFFKLRNWHKLPKKGASWQRDKCPPGLKTTALEAAMLTSQGENVGVDPGPRLCLIDTDSQPADQKFRAAFPNLRAVLIVKTPRGFHYWLRCPAGQTMQQIGIEPSEGDTPLGQGIDIRTHYKGYAVGPGSRTDKRAYQDKTPPPGGPVWHYSQISIDRDAVESPERLAQLVKVKRQATQAPQAQSRKANGRGNGTATVATGTRNKKARDKAWSLCNDPALSRDERIQRLRDYGESQFAKNPDGSSYWDGHESPEDMIDRATEKIAADPPALSVLDGGLVPHDNRNNAAFKLAARLFDDREITYQAVLNLVSEFAKRHFQAGPEGQPFTPAELENCVQAALKKKDANRPPEEGERQAAFFHYAPGNERLSFHNMLTAAYVEVSYNTFTETPELRRNGGDWRRMKTGLTGELSGLRTELPGLTRPKPCLAFHDGEPEIIYPAKPGGKKAIDQGWKLSEADFASHLGSIAWNERRNPIALQLAEIESRHRDSAIDGRALMTAWEGWYGCEKKYQTAMGFMLPMLLCGIVKRNLRPGAKHDMLPAIIGDPGLGKSTMLKSICWDPDTQFRDDYHFPKGGMGAIESQSHGQQYIGILVIELSENAAFRRADQEAVQADFSRSSVNFRRAWGRESSDPYLLHCVKAITHNLDDVIIRPAGVPNRRVLPVKALRINGDDSAKIIADDWRQDRDLYFAQALRLVKSGAWDAMLPDIEKEMLTLTPDHVRIDEVATDCLIDALRQFTHEEHLKGITRQAIMDKIIYPPRDMEKRFVKAIKELGFTGPHKTRVGNIGGHYWRLKPGSSL